ncbi:MAG: hypothetical protein E6J35_09135 [Chloroflexi bacterium]|nr:MAG: hypothetical protein E6J35_09135 [Chloroflexota bacterium]
MQVRADDGAGRVHDLGEDVGAAGEVYRATATAASEAVVRTRPALGRRSCGGLKRVIERGLDLLLHHQIHHRTGSDRGDRDGSRGEDGHAEAEAHGSLST